jgi:hypothetical protein
MTKRKKRMGRPRLAERPPTSSWVRDKERERDAASVALEARRRLFGAPEADAAQPEWETVLGRLYKMGELHPMDSPKGREIAKRMYEAGCLYREMRGNYDRVMMARQSMLVTKHRGFDGSDGTDPDYVAWAARIRQQHERCVLALMATMDLHATAAIEQIVVEDRTVGSLIGSLRLALNEVGKVLR